MWRRATTQKLSTPGGRVIAHRGTRKLSPGHVYLMIETLTLMDLHRGGSSPLARLPLGQGTDSEQTPSSCTVWTVGVGVPTQLARIHSIKTSSVVNLCRFCACWIDLANVLNLREISWVLCTAESHLYIMSFTIFSMCWTTVACTVESHALVVPSSPVDVLHPWERHGLLHFRG